MALKLKWSGDRLMLGRHVLAQLVPLASDTVGAHAPSIVGPLPGWTNERWEGREDARQDVGSAVAEELKALGAGAVEVAFE